jgi:hypothetical protein
LVRVGYLAINMPKTIISGTEHQETQNDRELKLLQMILANVFQIETKNWESVEHRAFALGRLETMIEYKKLIK